MSYITLEVTEDPVYPQLLKEYFPIHCEELLQITEQWLLILKEAMTEPYIDSLWPAMYIRALEEFDKAYDHMISFQTEVTEISEDCLNADFMKEEFQTLAQGWMEIVEQWETKEWLNMDVPDLKSHLELLIDALETMRLWVIEGSDNDE